MAATTWAFDRSARVRRAPTGSSVSGDATPPAPTIVCRRKNAVEIDGWLRHRGAACRGRKGAGGPRHSGRTTQTSVLGAKRIAAGAQGKHRRVSRPLACDDFSWQRGRRGFISTLPVVGIRQMAALCCLPRPFIHHSRVAM